MGRGLSRFSLRSKSSQTAVCASALCNKNELFSSPYFHEILGKGYRMDHLPFAILQEKGSEGFSLHGGTVDCRSGEYCPHLAYSCVNQHMHCHLLGVSVALADQNEGDGGFVVVRGSHKSNFQAPEEMIHGQEYQEFVYQPVIKAGDVLLFSEGTVHGARPWRADHQRRVALYRFSPATCAYGRSYYPTWPQSLLQGMNEEQLAVLLPPYALRLDRSYFPNNDPNSGLEVASRQQEKKDFDKLVFKTDYF